MADLTIKQSDTRPSFVITLTEGTPPAAINLTTATSVKLMFRPVGGGTVVTRPASITNAAQGQITVTFQSADTATAGVKQGEIEITWNDGGIQTIPNQDYLDIEIVDDVG